MTAYVGLGANLGSPRAQLDAAFSALGALPATRLTGRSSLYRSAPLGYAAQPDFINAAARLDTGLAPLELLDALLAIEAQAGRRREFRDAPRTLDLDLLLYGADALRSARLEVPHPRMHERAFVLRPLVELDPALEVPGRGRAAALLAALAAQPVERVA